MDMVETEPQNEVAYVSQDWELGQRSSWLRFTRVLTLSFCALTFA